MTPNWQTTTSKLASANGSASASACLQLDARFSAGLAAA